MNWTSIAINIGIVLYILTILAIIYTIILENRNPEKLEKLEQEIQALYLQIMENPNMQAFDTAKQAMNMMMQEVDTILSLCANGEDPDRCHPDLTNCTGNCSSCGGCH